MSPIKDLTDRIRPPRLGKIRIGEKTEKGYPISRDHFVCPDEVKAVYGDEPKELDIMFLSDDIEDVFPAYYKMYGQTAGLKCRGDGITADRLNKATGEFEEIECPGRECPEYEAKQCRRIGALKFLLPKVNGLGIWEIDTSSYNSILNIYSIIGPNGLIRALTKGRIRMIPFKLCVERREVQTNGKKQKVSVLELRCDQVNLDKIMTKVISEEKQPQIEQQVKLEPKAEKSLLDRIIEALEQCPNMREFNKTIGEMAKEINSLSGDDKDAFVLEKQNIEYRLTQAEK